MEIFWSENAGSNFWRVLVQTHPYSLEAIQPKIKKSPARPTLGSNPLAELQPKYLSPGTKRASSLILSTTLVSLCMGLKLSAIVKSTIKKSGFPISKLVNKKMTSPTRRQGSHPSSWSNWQSLTHQEQVQQQRRFRSLWSAGQLIMDKAPKNNKVEAPRRCNRNSSQKFDFLQWNCPCHSRLELPSLRNTWTVIVWQESILHFLSSFKVHNSKEGVMGWLLNVNEKGRYQF